jgi:hypothetical protein
MRRNGKSHAKGKRIFTEEHKAASPRPNTKKSFTQEGHKGRKETPYQEFKAACSCPEQA